MEVEDRSQVGPRPAHAQVDAGGRHLRAAAQTAGLDDLAVLAEAQHAGGRHFGPVRARSVLEEALKMIPLRNSQDFIQDGAGTAVGETWVSLTAIGSRTGQGRQCNDRNEVNPTQDSDLHLHPHPVDALHLAPGA